MKKAKLLKVKNSLGKETYVNERVYKRLKHELTLVKEDAPAEVEKAKEEKKAAEEEKKEKANAEAENKAKAEEAAKEKAQKAEEEAKNKKKYKELTQKAKTAFDGGKVNAAKELYEAAAKIDNNRFVKGQLKKIEEILEKA